MHLVLVHKGLAPYATYSEYCVKIWTDFDRLTFDILQGAFIHTRIIHNQGCYDIQ